MTRILVTSALPYINGIKHLGNLVGSMLPADVYARFQRARGHEVLYICATDEHGTPAELAAREAGMDVAEYCREQHLAQKEVGERFHLSWDYFGRSSSPQNRHLTQHFADRLDDNGLIEERTIRQVYSVDDGRFLPDRYIVGTCPRCGYDLARGDQCENCTSVLDPTDLIDARSAISGSTNLEVRESRHLYLRQSAMVDRLRAWIDTKADWPALVRSIAYKWLDEGLEDRGITRDLDWGIPVAHDGKWASFAGKVFYVWFDAPIEYIAATKEWADENPDARDWQSWWYGASAREVRYVQFMGKDNVPFHTVGFPVTLLGSGEPWKLVDYIKGFNWMNYYGGKFSTSQKRGVFMDQALDILPADHWRYYLMANIPESSDTSFTWEQLVVAVNKDLADVLGNFVNRLLRFASSRFGETVPDGGRRGTHEVALIEALSHSIEEYVRCMERLEFRKAMHELRRIWTIGNEYLSAAGPWTLYKSDPAQAACSTRTGINLVRLFAVLSSPVTPDLARKMLQAVNVPPSEVEIPDWMLSADMGPKLAAYLDTIPAGHSFTVPDVLVRKIDDDQVEEWRKRFGGL